MIHREMRKRDAIRFVTLLSCAEILKLSKGESFTTYHMVQKALSERGYSWKNLPEMRSVLTKDQGKTYLIDDIDLIDVSLRVSRILGPAFIQTENPYQTAVVGLPYHIPSIRK